MYAKRGFVRCERYNENPQAKIFMVKDIGDNRGLHLVILFGAKCDHRVDRCGSARRKIGGEGGNYEQRRSGQ